MNVIVISLKDEFYAHSDALIGVCPDNANGKRLLRQVFFVFLFRNLAILKQIMDS